MRDAILPRFGASPESVMGLQLAIVGIRPPIDFPHQGQVIEIPAEAT